MTLIESIETYFNNETDNKETRNASEGICSNFWKRQELLSLKN